MSNKNSISYRRVGDYNIPNLTLPSEESAIRLGKWGMMHKDYLQKHPGKKFTTGILIARPQHFLTAHRFLLRKNVFFLDKGETIW